METQTIKLILKKIFKKHFLLNYYYLNNNLYLEDMGLSPLEKLELVFYLEEKFKITLEDQDIDGLLTIGDVIKCVEKHTSAACVLA